jgi:ectoine hydroxylase-related dioxygenase (phytanoyl-CoA dioxygenase family)
MDICMNIICQEFEEKGYVVIPNILNKDEIKEYIDEFNYWMDSIPNSEYLHNLIDCHGLFKHHQVAHQRFAWLLRTNPKIINVFKSFWDTDKLVVSFDGCCYYPSDYKEKESYWIHSDQSSLKKGMQCIQSFVSLTSNKERTFVVYEGSHKLHEEHAHIYNIDNSSDWNPINQEYIETIQDRKKILHVKAGSMVLWDSRTFHQNTCGPENSKEERLVQYLCYLPENSEINDEAMRTLRYECYYYLRTTNHYPYPIAKVPLQPNNYNHYNNDNLYIDYSLLQPPDLDDLLEKIYDLL